MAGNPSAFPSGDFRGCEPGYGMTLRDWFAGQALSQSFDYACNRPESLIGRDYLPEEWAAKMAYALADAMLAERNKAIAAATGEAK